MTILDRARGLFRPKAIAEVSGRNYTAGEMADFLRSSMPELAESYTRADIELALDDRDWLNPGRRWTSADTDPQTRTTLVANARLYWLRDPLMKQAVRLWTDYALGTGVSWDSKDQKIKDACDDFAYCGRNPEIMDSEGQRRSSKKLLVDGELFFALYEADEGKKAKTIRPIDCLQMTDIICDPDDETRVLGYRRLTAGNKILYYPHWRNDDEENDLLESQPDPVSKGGKIGDKIQEKVVVYHLPFDTLLKRGNGLLSCNLDWSKEHRKFMEARVAIQAALSKFAWKGKVKGGQGIINQLQSKMQSSHVNTGPTQVERHPQPAPGATWLENGGVDLTPMPRATGAGDARSDGDQLKLMVSAGTGIALHYFGDNSTGNLATSTAMELPMLKMFGSYQSLWRDAYEKIFMIARSADLQDREAQTALDITLPPILLDDLRKIGQFVSLVAGVFPEIRVPEVLRAMLNSMNIDNVDEVMDSVENMQGQLALAAQQDKDHQLAIAKARGAAANGPNDPNDPNDPDQGVDDPAPDPATPAGGTKTSEARQTRALNRLAKALEESR